MSNVLYISYDGIFEPLGRSQVLKYLEKLSQLNHNIYLISFEKRVDYNKNNFNEFREDLLKKNIKWKYLIYHKKPKIVSSLFDIIICFFYSVYILKKKNINIIHARSYLPGFIAYIIKLFFNVNFIFDIRGFWADERIDGNIWKKNSLIYKITKSLEKKIFLSADYIVTLTKKSQIEISNFTFFQLNKKKCAVIPTCTDFSQFKLPINLKKNNHLLTFGYVGSVGTWYEFDKVLSFFSFIKSKIGNSTLIILNNKEHSIINKKILNYPDIIDSVKVLSVEHSDIHNHIMNFDIGIFFIKKCYSKIASSPTKLGEFLSLGVPVVTGPLIGDVDDIISSPGLQVGTIVSNFDNNNLEIAYKELMLLIKDEGISSKCIYTAKKYFDLNFGVSEYNKIYNFLDS